MFFLTFLIDELFAPPRLSHDVRVSSLCIFTDPASLATRTSPSTSSNLNTRKGQKACLVVGVGLRRYDLFGNTNSTGLVQVLNDVNQANCKESKPPLDIMKLENLPDMKPDSDNSRPSDSELSSHNNLSSPQKGISSVNSSNQSPKNFVPYLLVYDLSHLTQTQTFLSKENSDEVRQRTCKKSTRKAHPSNYSLFKVIEGGKSLDHIYTFPSHKNKSSNLKNGPSSVSMQSSSVFKKMPKCSQCIPLPHKLNKLKLQLFVDLILISPCCHYLLVSLQQFHKSQGNQSNEMMATAATSSSDAEKSTITGGFILYRICSSDESLFLQEDPISINFVTHWSHVAKEIVMIPDMVKLNLIFKI